MGSPAAIYDAFFGSYNIRQVTNVDYQPNYEFAVEKYSGGVTPQQISIVTGDPVISFETADIAGVIASLSATAGLAITSAGTITIPFQDRTAGGTFEGALSHQTLSATLGLLIPVEISASQDSKEAASAKLEMYPASSTGLADPVAINTGVTPAAQAFVGAYDMGPVKIASTLIGNVKSFRQMFGITVKRERFGGGAYASIDGIYIVSVEPKLEVTFHDAASAQSAGLYAAVASTATAFLRARAAGGTHTADASLAHVALTITGGLHALDGGSGETEGDVKFTRTIIGKTLAFSSASAIS